MVLILSLLLILGFILLSILVIPFHISLNLNKTGKVLEGVMELKWLKIRLITKKFPEEDRDKKKKTEREDKKEEKSKWLKFEFSLKELKKTIILLIQSRKYFLKFFEIIWDSFHLEILKIRIILGFQSAAETASTVGYMWAAASLINIHPKLDFYAAADFNRERIDGNLFLKFNIQLLKPIIASIWLLTKKPVLKFLWNLRKL